ncbi:MAG TPA: hypothetical protein VIL47_00560, partial [Candidatus Bipolaricaulota bacterium]
MASKTKAKPEAKKAVKRSVENVGYVISVRGPIVDVKFPQGELPRVNDACTIEREGGEMLVLEAAQHLSDDAVR